MIAVPVVIDAAACLEYLLRTDVGRPTAALIEDPATDLHAPALCDAEVGAGLARAVQLELISEDRARRALIDYRDLPVLRYGHSWLLTRMLELQPDFSPYGAIYVALAERLDATLLTGDASLTRAARGRLSINVVGTAR